MRIKLKLFRRRVCEADLQALGFAPWHRHGWGLVLDSSFKSVREFLDAYSPVQGRADDGIRIFRG